MPRLLRLPPGLGGHAGVEKSRGGRRRERHAFRGAARQAPSPIRRQGEAGQFYQRITDGGEEGSILTAPAVR